MSNIIFGPINSRRFGSSLGVDLSPFTKQCNFDCLYCELLPAKTTDKQISTILPQNIIKELKIALLKYPKIDVITFTANGEPTIYPHLDELMMMVNKIKQKKKTLILSNGGNIYKKDIQNSLKIFDIVKLSLDCLDENCFRKLDRVDKTVDTQKIVDGMISFRKIYHKQLILETMFVKNINDKPSHIKSLYHSYKQIKADRIDISTIDRPPAYDVKPLTYEELSNIASNFTALNVTIASKNKNIQQNSYDKDEIVNLLQKRPLATDDINILFDENSKLKLQELIKEKKIYIKKIAGVGFFKLHMI